MNKVVTTITLDFNVHNCVDVRIVLSVITRPGLVDASRVGPASSALTTARTDILESTVPVHVQIAGMEDHVTHFLARVCVPQLSPDHIAILHYSQRLIHLH